MKSFKQFVVEATSEDRLRTDAKKFLDKEGLKYKIEKSSLSRDIKLHLDNGYSVGPGTVYHNKYTLYKKSKEIGHYNSMDDLFKQLDKIE